ncbi:MAG TPA: hypothetical protein PLX77_03895 [Candidatus Cloacimonadota bacterium]|nr:hypothetical protein [Candidatus Cloacimonadota bacterium]
MHNTMRIVIITVMLMGSIAHAIDTELKPVSWERSFENHPDAHRWYWVSFPVLDAEHELDNRICKLLKSLTHTHFDAENSLVPTYLDDMTWMNHGYADHLRWHDSDWTPQVFTHRITSAQGYKIGLLPRVTSDYPAAAVVQIQGTKAPDSLSFDEYSGIQNWLGYFLLESQNPEKALGAIWDDVLVAKTKEWCLIRDAKSGEMHGVSYPLNSGDMLVLVTRNDHHLAWSKHQSVTPRSRASPSYFICDEKQDFVPLYIHLPKPWNKEIREIGLYVRGELKGAVVVEDSLEQISAYIDKLEELTEDDVELAFKYKGTGESEDTLGFLNLEPGRLEAQYGAAKNRYPFFELSINAQDIMRIAPPKFSLRQNHPNPFNWSTTISFSLPQDTPVRLDIFNLEGQLVKTLIDDTMPAGIHKVKWNTKDMKNKIVPRGVYRYSLSSPGTTESKSMLLMK